MLDRAAANLLGLERRPVDSEPKRFAARIGFAFSFIAGTLALFGIVSAAKVVAAMLLGAALLEALFGYCVGCKIYALLPHRHGVRSSAQDQG